MRLKEILERFEGEEVDFSKQADFARWALNYFHDRSVVIDPYIDVTIQWEITHAEEVYRKNFAATQGSSLTAYLFWNLIRCLSKHDCFQFRHLEGKWYHLKKAPIMMPIAVGGAKRFRDAYLLEDIYGTSWQDFCGKYRQELDRAQSEEDFTEANREGLFYLSTLLGNLPYFSFTALSAQKTTCNSGRSVFYFGKRYTLENKLYIPLYVSLDHCNTDPFVLNAFLEDFKSLSEEIPAMR